MENFNWRSWAPPGEGRAPRRMEREEYGRGNAAGLVKVRKKLMATAWRQARVEESPPGDRRREALEQAVKAAMTPAQIWEAEWLEANKPRKDAVMEWFEKNEPAQAALMKKGGEHAEKKGVTRRKFRTST